MIGVGLLKGHFTMEWLFCWLWLWPPLFSVSAQLSGSAASYGCDLGFRVMAGGMSVHLMGVG